MKRISINSCIRKNGPARDVAAILFDKDGTLFDFQASWGRWAYDLIYELASGETALIADLAERIGYDLGARGFRADSLSVAGTITDQAVALNPALPHMSRTALIDHLREAAERAEMAPAVPLAPFLDELLARGLKLGIATNDAEQAAHAHLAAAGVGDRFEFVAGYDSGFGAKPDPGMCLAFADRLGLDPAKVLMVGDSSHDLIAANAAGMWRVAVLTGTASKQDLEPHADVVLPHIGHLPRWLDR